jgi:anti-sigma regulatory factor (Ser/Thr protein kinase)
MEQPLLNHVGRIAVPADPDGVTGLRRWVTEMARGLGVDEPTCRRVALAVSEAATNAVLHAYEGGDGTIAASLTRSGDELEVVVSDEGQGLRPRSDSPGLGMGLGIIADVTNHLEIDARPGSGTVVRMWFTACTGEAPREAG